MKPPAEFDFSPPRMVPVSEIPDIVEQIYRMPLRVYQRAAELGTLPENVELLRGIVVAKMSKSSLHEALVFRLMRLLLAILPTSLTVRIGAPVTMIDSEPEPDLAVVEARADDWILSHPTMAELVVEVAVTSLGIDREKALIYAEAGFPEYWLIHAEEKIVTVYREPTVNGYRSVQDYSGSATLSAARFAFTVTLPELFP